MQNTTKRLMVWAVVVALILLIPLVLTIRDGGVPGVGWNWKPGGFIFAFVMLFGTGLAIDFAARKIANPVYRSLAITAIVLALLLIWVEIVTDAVSSAIKLLF